MVKVPDFTSSQSLQPTWGKERTKSNLWNTHTHTHKITYIHTLRHMHTITHTVTYTHNHTHYNALMYTQSHTL